MLSARDYEGHGSHTLSTAGGNVVPGANVFGFGNGTASGGSPKARVAAYKACWPPGCFDADIFAAFEAAISDGVNVITMSVGSENPSEFSESAISVGSFHAVSHGITLIASGGNSGPVPGSVSNNEPWTLTVGASTIDRDFASNVVLGNRKIFKVRMLFTHTIQPCFLSLFFFVFKTPFCFVIARELVFQGLAYHLTRSTH